MKKFFKWAKHRYSGLCTVRAPFLLRTNHDAQVADTFLEVADSWCAKFQGI
jgi:hypothetical protein